MALISFAEKKDVLSHRTSNHPCPLLAAEAGKPIILLMIDHMARRSN